jgi:hypothetical protein
MSSFRAFVRNQTVKSVISVLIAITPAVGAQDAVTGGIKIDGALHPCSEIMQLVEQSSLSYTLDSFTDSEWTVAQDRKEWPVLSHEMLIAQDDNGLRITARSLSDSCKALIDEAESVFKAKKYADACAKYRLAYACDSNYAKTLVYVGDTFFGLGNYDSAQYYYRAAIIKNPIDYQAHWFLADVLWELGRKDEAVRELTIAHLYNRNHKTLLETLISFRSKAGREWKEWTFEPRYELRQDPADSHIVYVKCAPEWAGYALTKALWQYEPGYAERMMKGEGDTLFFNPIAEKEALGCAFTAKEQFAYAATAIDSGYVNQFLFYELLARKMPHIMLVLADSEIARLVEYVDKFH